MAAAAVPEHAPEHFDVLVIGAGLSGIGAGYHLQTRFPNRSYAILEARNASGGTWDLFRYPGVRSDSDMYTLGYRFRPWLEQEAIAGGPAILKYIRETAAHYGIDRKIRYGHRLTRASWSSADARWTVDVALTGEDSRGDTGKKSPGEIGADSHSRVGRTVFTCNVLYTCTGYYDYNSGFTPTFTGIEQFKGQVVHPQQWPESLDYRNKRVVVVGSGATAITLVPAMADDAAHVTMLQRSPTYVLSRPARDTIAQMVQKVLPQRAAYAAVRWKNVGLSIASFAVARRYPQFMRNFIAKGVKRELGNEFDVATHFNPRYNPWDERMCLAPNADFFAALNSGKASVVTAEIETFTATGIQLKSGQHLDADIVVTATGLNLRLLSGVELVVDGSTVTFPELMAYKGMMFSDVPNLVAAFGYTNASWTLKCDLTAEYTCRLLEHMDRGGYRQFTPRRNDPTITAIPVLDFTSGYVQRALGHLPSQGSRKPWRVHQNYVSDLMTLRFGKVDDGVMEFV